MDRMTARGSFEVVPGRPARTVQIHSSLTPKSERVQLLEDCALFRTPIGCRVEGARYTFAEFVLWRNK